MNLDPASTLSLREFVPSDYSELISWFADADALRLFAGSLAEWPMTIEQLTTRADEHASDAFTAVFDDSGTTVGHLEMVRETTERVRFARIAIAPNLRGRGLIAQLLESASDQARNAGFNSVSLLVIPSNSSALRAYTRAGFADVGVSAAYPEYIRMLRRI